MKIKSKILKRIVAMTLSLTIFTSTLSFAQENLQDVKVTESVKEDKEEKSQVEEVSEVEKDNVEVKEVEVEKSIETKSLNTEITKSETKYSIEVENGYAQVDGEIVTEAYEGVFVDIYPDIIKGKAFDHWEVVEGNVALNDPNYKYTDFYMPAENVKLKAVYRKVEKHSIEVENGVAKVKGKDVTEAYEDESVDIYADRIEGKAFDHWEVVEGNVTINNPNYKDTDFYMLAENVKVRAVYRDVEKYSIEVENGVAKVEGTVVTEANEGETVYIDADKIEGKAFDHWEVVEGNVHLSATYNKNTGFYMPAENVKLKAVYRNAKKHSIEVENGYAQVEGTVTTEVYEGKTVYIFANRIEGKAFDHWEVVEGNVTLAGLNSKITWFNMPAENLKLKAVYRDVEKYSVVVENGVAEVEGTVVTEAYEGETVYIDANRIEGKAFDHWEVVEGNITLEEPNYKRNSFSMPTENVKLKAVYRDLEKYSVEVENGVARVQGKIVTEAYEAEKVYINADRIEGKAFDHWEIIEGNVTLADLNSEITWFYMPSENLKLKAVYRDAEKYSIEVENGVAEVKRKIVTEAYEGETVYIDANRIEGKAFDHWEIIEGNVTLADLNSEITWFYMPSENLKLKAVYRDVEKYSVEVENGYAQVEGKIATEVYEAERVDIYADRIEGKAFDHWEVIEGNVTLDNINDGFTYFTMPAENVKLKAVYRNAEKYNIEVENGVAKVKGKDVTEAYEENIVEIYADEIEGKEFDHWEVVEGDIRIANPTKKATIFFMPAENVKLKAVHRDAEKYNIEIENGIALNSEDEVVNKADKDEEIWIFANSAPEGKVFDHWEVVEGNITLNEPNSERTWFDMPAENVKIKAVYKNGDSDITGNYKIEVENGIAVNSEGEVVNKADKGEEIWIAPNSAPEGKVFDHWEVVEGDVSIANPTKKATIFLMPAENVKIKAVYNVEKYKIEVENGIALNSEDEIVNKADKGEEIWIIAYSTPVGKVFERWEVVEGNVTLTDSTNSATTFTMPAENVKVKAVYRKAEKHSIEVENGVAKVSNIVVTDAEESEVVTIVANSAPVEKVFERWEVVKGNVTLTDSTNSTTTFTMPAENVKVKAVYKDEGSQPADKYQVEVVNGVAKVSNIVVTDAEEGEVVTIVANPAPVAMVFERWEVVEGNITLADTLYPTTSFTMPAENVKIKAKYILIFDNVVDDDNNITVPSDLFTITYDLNGGVLDGNVGEIKVTAFLGETITIAKAPTRAGYKFLHWKGSMYLPGESYVVTENHKFVAQWEKITDNGGQDDNGQDDNGQNYDDTSNNFTNQNKPTGKVIYKVVISKMPQTAIGRSMMAFATLLLSGLGLYGIVKKKED